MITATVYLNTVFTVEIENTSNNKHSFIRWVNIYRLPFKTNIKPVFSNLLSCKVGIVNSHMKDWYWLLYWLIGILVNWYGIYI